MAILALSIQIKSAHQHLKHSESFFFTNPVKYLNIYWMNSVQIYMVTLNIVPSAGQMFFCPILRLTTNKVELEIHRYYSIACEILKWQNVCLKNKLVLSWIKAYISMTKTIQIGTDLRAQPSRAVTLQADIWFPPDRSSESSSSISVWSDASSVAGIKVW